VTTPTLRPPRRTDYPVLTRWIVDADLCIRWAGPRVPFPFATTELENLLAVDGSSSYCLDDGGADPCGFGQHWVLTPGGVHLGRLIVSPDVRGKGYGRQLCQQLMAQAVSASNARFVTLRVYRDNLAAFTLYASLGFKPVEAESTDEVYFMQADSVNPR